MGTLRKISELLRSDFHTVTVGASIISAVLWMSAGIIATRTENIYNFIIVGILAVLSAMVAVNSARVEGFRAGRLSVVSERVKGDV